MSPCKCKERFTFVSSSDVKSSKRYFKCIPKRVFADEMIQCVRHLNLNYTLFYAVLFLIVIIANPSHAQSFRQNITVPDQQPAGSVIGQVGYGIPSAKPPFAIYLADDKDSNVFEVMINGTIKLKIKIDRSIKSFYEFLAVANDIITIQVTIQVLPLSNRAPVFSSGSVNLSIPETASVDSTFFLGSANDPDFGSSGIASYEIVGGNTNGVFRLVVSQAPNGAKIVNLGLTKSLDYKTTPKYVLTVRAYDTGTPPLYDDMRVTVNVINVLAYQPVFNASSYSAVIREDVRIGTSILRTFAAHRDPTIRSQMTFSFDQQTSDRGFDDFVIDQTTGVISVIKNLSYARQSSYQIAVLAADVTIVRLLGTSTVTIQVLETNPEPPAITLIFLSDDGSAKVTKSANTHDPIAYVSASYSDQQDGLSINMTLLGGDGYFALQKVGNVVYLVVVSRSLDSAKSSYHMSVFAQDTVILSKFSYRNFTLYVVDGDEREVFFAQNPYYAMLESTVIPGTPVVTVSLVATGVLRGNVTYEILPREDSFYEWFYIDRFSGAIVSAVGFDCRSPSSFRLVVNALDSSFLVVATTNVVVNMKFVYNSSPFFRQSFYEIEVSDSTPVSTCVTQISVPGYLDCPPEKMDRIVYSLEGAASKQYPFFLNPNSGNLCVRDPLDALAYPTYDLSITATNEAGFKSLSLLRINLIASKRFPPMFISNGSRAVIYDNTAPGSDIILVKAVGDRRSPERNISYQIVRGNFGSVFSIDPDSGYIKLQRNLPSVPTSYHLAIVAIDDAITVSDINADVSIDIVVSTAQSFPMFTKHVYELRVAENAPRGQLVGKVETIGTLRVKYSVISSNFPNWFQLDSSSGEILTTNQLNYENASFVLLDIQAKSSDDPNSSSGYAQVLITLIDANDNAPTFTASHVTLQLSENTDTGSLLYVAKATDQDGGNNGVIYYSLIDSSSTFSINSLGELRLIRPLSSTSPSSFSIVATDGGVPSKATALNVTLVIVGSNKNAPAFQSSNYRFTAANWLQIGSLIGVVTADDADGANRGNVSYFLRDVSLTNMFLVDPAFGRIYNKVLLDVSMQRDYVFSVVAVDRGFPERSSTTEVRITIEDDDFSGILPVSGTTYNFSISENLPPYTSIGFIGGDGEVLLTNCFAFLLAKPNSYFSVDFSSGEILSVVILDREEIPLHRFDVVVSDCGVLPRSATVSVAVAVADVNDNSPRFDRHVDNVFLAENQPQGTRVVQTVAKDADFGPNGTVRYYFPQENSQFYGQHFEIDSTTGWISTKEKFDQQSKGEFTLKIIGQDEGQPPRRSTFVLRVVVADTDRNDVLPPSFRYVFSVPENVPIGTNITSLAENSRGSREYYLVSGNAFNSFAVDTISGLLYVALLLDYETWSSFSLSIMIIDNDPNDPVCSIIAVTVNVIDVNDVLISFAFDPTTLRIRENIPMDTDVYRIAISESDSPNNESVEYSVLSQNPSGWFCVDRNTGFLTVNSEIDFETVKQIVFVVMATGRGVGRRVTATVVVEVIDVNDRAPEFETSQAVETSIFRDVAEGTIVADFHVENDDIGNFREISYKILSGDETSRFHLDPKLGLLTLARSLEQQTTDIFRLNISATVRDHYSSLASTCLFTVKVVEPNKNSPVFDRPLYYATVVENSPPGTVITAVNAVVRNGNVTYGIPSSGQSGAGFVVNPVNGIITTVGLVDREVSDGFQLTVFAKTDRFPAHFSAAVVQVQVLDANDNAPVFSASLLVLDVPENVGPAIIHVLTASDDDIGVNGLISYYITGGNTDSRFYLDRMSGELWCTPLDREAIAFYNLTVVAVDGGSPSQTGSLTVLVNVLDDNDNDPVFQRVSYTVSVPANVSVGSSVLRVEAADIDDGLNGNISYTISNEAFGMFSIDQNTGALSVARALVQLSMIAYSFNVTATDRCPYRPRSRVAVVNVTLLSTNGNTALNNSSPFPRFCADRYIAYVWENNIRLTYVAEVKAIVPVTGGPSTGGLTFWISSGNVQNAFVLDPPNSGVVKTNVILDREVRDSYKIDVQSALQGQQSSDSASVSLSVQVVDVNDNAPFFPVYRPVSIREGLKPGTQVLQVTANDVDLYPLPTYRLVSVNCRDCPLCDNANGTFSVDRFSGKIWTNDRLDFESCSSFQLNIQASDQLHNASMQVQISVLDDNDNPPIFSQSLYEASVQEGALVGSIVAQVTATDKDSGNNGRIVYSLESSANEFVSINASTGNIYLVKTPKYDANRTTVYFTVTATDQGSPPLSSTATAVFRIAESNRRPVFDAASYSVLISPETSAGSSLVRLPASDPNLDYDNSRCTFSISGGNESMFGIGRDSGVVYLLTDLLYSETMHFMVKVMVEDWGTPPLNSTTTVVINLRSNGFPLNLEKDIVVSVLENASVGSVLTTTLRDGVGQGQMLFNISSGNDDGVFAIVPTTGAISLKSPLNFDLRSVHRLVVSAADPTSDVPQRMIFSTVVVNVTEVNKYRPKFPAVRYLVAITENLRNGTYVQTVQATDGDTGIFGVLKYRLLSDFSGLLRIDELSGEIYTLKSLTARDGNSSFTVIAEDLGGWSASASLLISVKPEPVQPQFSQKSYSFKVPTNAKIGEIVGTVQALGDNGLSIKSILYILRPPSEYFAINHTTGEVYVIRNLEELVKARRRRSALSRHKRAAENVTLRVVAQSGFLQRKEDEAEAVIFVNGSCAGCSLASPQQSSGLRGPHLILVVVFVVFGVLVVAVVAIVCAMIRRRKLEPKNESSVPNPPGELTDENSSPDFTAKHLCVTQKTNFGARPTSEQSHSASSGRGSVEKNDDIDEEIQMINAVPSTMPSSRIPDSGIQQDDDTVSEFSVHNHREYLARLGIDVNVIADKAARNGGGMFELEAGDIVYTQLDGSDANSLVDDDAIARTFGNQDIRRPNPANLTSIINNEEVFSGSYNWDYLIDWGPQFLPMADLFSEIAGLKDGDVRPKTQPTQIVPQVPGTARQPRILPPPLIVDTPPRAAPVAGPSSALPPRSRTSSNRSCASSTCSYMPSAHGASTRIDHSSYSSRSSVIGAAPVRGKIPPKPPMIIDNFASALIAPSFKHNILPLEARSPIEIRTFESTNLNVLNHRPLAMQRTSILPNRGGIEIHEHEFSSEQEIHI